MGKCVRYEPALDGLEVAVPPLAGYDRSVPRNARGAPLRSVPAVVIGAPLNKIFIAFFSCFFSTFLLLIVGTEDLSVCPIPCCILCGESPYGTGP